MSDNDKDANSEISDLRSTKDGDAVSDMVSNFSDVSSSLGQQFSDDEQRLRKEPIDRELDVRPSKSGKRRSRGVKGPVEIDPKWLIPFEHGWRRELVHRSMASGEMLEKDHNAPADVYYYAPGGKKLRSAVQIEAHCKEAGSVLSGENFTLRKALIYKEPEETRRFAGRTGKAKAGSPKIPPKSSPVPGGRGVGGKRGRGKRTDPVGRTENENYKSTDYESEESDIVPAAKRSKNLESTDVTSPKSYTELQPAAPGQDKDKKSAQKQAVEPSEASVSESLPGQSSPPKSRFEASPRLCGLECPGLVNVPPSLQCSKCMMLFHPQCVNHQRDSKNANDNFVCSNCSNYTAGGSESKAAAAPAPKKPRVTSVDLTKIIHANQVTGQLLTLPPSVLNHLDLKQPLALRVDDKVLMIPPNCFISSGSAMKVFLPPGTLPKNLLQEPTQPVNFNFQSKHNQQVLNFSIGRPVKKTGGEDGEVRGENKENGTEKNGRLSKKQVKLMTPGECFFQKLHTGYDCMITIFKYLKVADLLRAARVCRTWKKVAKQDCLWKVVRLKGSRVSSWEGAAEAFKSHSTYCLDLREMLFFEDMNRTWHQFTAVLPKLETIRQIYFGRSPAMMLTAVTDNLTQLQVLSAEFITDVLPESQIWSTSTRLDVGKFANLKNLETLKLRGVCGILLPAFSFKGGPPALESLTNLKTLVLSTLRDASVGEFTFLKSLKNLETLEMGDCEGWDASTYEQIKFLTKLRSLRLESGGVNPEPALGDSLKHLKSLENLELIKFAIHSNMGDTLKSLTKLTSLSIWPDRGSNTAENNTNTLNAVMPLTSIKTFDWGVMSKDTEEETSASKGAGKDKKETFLSFIDEEAEKRDAGDGKRPEKTLSIERIMSLLCAQLPKANIKIYKMPVIKSGAD